MSTNHPSVVVISGSEAGTILGIDEVLNDFSIGADDDCHLTLSGPSVSPMHAALFLDDEGNVFISDTKSRAGVFVNGKKVIEATLGDGDEIFLGSPDDPGSLRLRFVAAGSELPAVESGDPGLPELAGMELSEPFDLGETLSTGELDRPGFEAEGGPGIGEGGPPLTPPPPLVMDKFPPPEPLPEFEPLPAAEPPPAPEPLPAAEPPPAPEPLPAAEPLPPVVAATPAPVAAATPVAATPPPGTPARTAGPLKSQPVRRTSDIGDDPLAGLAESLGGGSGERSAPPLPMVEAPTDPVLARKAGPSRAVSAARLAVVAAVLGGLAWFGIRRYSESIVVPVIDTYLPNPAEPGQTVTINGSGFGPNPGPDTVKVSLGSSVAVVLDANPTRLNVMVPESLGAAGSQTLPLSITAGGSTSSSRLLKVAVIPKVESVTPRVALTGEEVVIAGQWLANDKTQPKVIVAGNEAEILAATPSSVRIRVPQVAAREGQKVSVRVAVGPDLSKEAPLHYGRLPFVDTVLPERALPGDVVTVTGLGLSDPDLSVVVGGRNAVVLSSTDTELKVSVPGIRLSESPGRRELLVRSRERASAGRALEILRESSALYTPRFFVEMMEGGRVSVSSELGPAMVLGSDIGSKTRAQTAATRLNALVGPGRANRVQFSAADLAINGPGGAVITLAQGDGAGNPRALAGLWAAQLTDRFDLFLQGRRPGRTVELSPDGKVFLDIFAASRRRSNQPGVPPGILFSPDPAWSRALATLASSPTFGSGQATALLDGYWSGAIEGPGANAPRKIEISLTATPSGLVGQRTSRQGRLSTDVTLGNLGYSRRELRFSFVDSGENLNFSGRLDGDVIEGVVTKSSGARVGTLTLKLTR